MTICRYFIQGNCRFGERCRFEHTESNTDSYDHRNVGVRSYDGGYQERYGRQYGQSNYGYENQYRNDRYESNNYYNQQQRSYSPDRYSENYRPESPPRYSSGTYGYQSNKYKQNYQEHQGYNEQNYERKQQYSNYQNENVYGQNRFKWISDDFKKQNQKSPHHSSTEYVNNDYSTSTPKSNVPFSFKVPESEIKKGSTFSHYHVDEQDQLHANVVKEDAKSWELGGLWPFTCYFPCPDKFGFPGFCDVSAEELRYAAYKAEESNAYQTYVQSVQNVLLLINQQRSQLQIPTPQLLATLKKIWAGEDLYSASASNIIASIPFIQFGEMGTDTIDTPATMTPAVTAASFSFKMTTDTDSPFKPSAASNFSFKLPSVSETKSSVLPGPDGDVNVYTPFGSLTIEEKEQFSASTFILGKIPTKPPSQGLCI